MPGRLFLSPRILPELDPGHLLIKLSDSVFGKALTSIYGLLAGAWCAADQVVAGTNRMRPTIDPEARSYAVSQLVELAWKEAEQIGRTFQ